MSGCKESLNGLPMYCWPYELFQGENENTNSAIDGRYSLMKINRRYNGIRMFFIMNWIYPKMPFIAFNSSGENETFSRHLSESSNCSGLLTPISTEVMRFSFRTQESAI